MRSLSSKVGEMDRWRWLPTSTTYAEFLAIVTLQCCVHRRHRQNIVITRMHFGIKFFFKSMVVEPEELKRTWEIVLLYILFSNDSHLCSFGGQKENCKQSDVNYCVLGFYHAPKNQACYIHGSHLFLPPVGDIGEESGAQRNQVTC